VASPDTSGNGHVARCTQCPMVVAGKNGNGFRFDGVDDILVVDASPALDTTTGYTVTAWIFVDPNPTAIECLLNKGLGPSSNSWQVCVQASGQLVHITDGGDLYDGPATPFSSWHHVAIRWDANEKTTWLDGALMTTTSRTSLNFDTETMRMGADIDFNATSAPFRGALDDVRLYSRPLNLDEIALLAAE
jgi:hypothetical protein